MINVGGRSLGKQLYLYGNPSVLNIPDLLNDVPPMYCIAPVVQHRYYAGCKF